MMGDFKINFINLDKYFNILWRFRVTVDGILDWRIDLLAHTHHSLVAAGNYNAVANPHTLQITAAHAKSSQFAFTSRFLVADLSDEDPSSSLLASSLAGEYPETPLRPTQLNRPGVFVI
jgi:hypothetical protein